MARAKFAWRGNRLVGIFPNDHEGNYKPGRQGRRRTLCTEDELILVPKAEREKWIMDRWHAMYWQIINEEAIKGRKRDEKRRLKKRSTIREASRQWLDDVKARQHHNTWTKYRKSIDLYLELMGDSRLSEFGRAENNAFMAKLKTVPSNRPPHNPISLQTQNIHVRHLQGFLTWCHDMEFMDKHIKLKKPSVPTKDMDVLDVDDLDRLRRHLEAIQGTGRDARSNRRLRNLLRAFMLGCHTLMRSGHLWALKLDRIDMERRVIRITDNPDLNWQAKGLKWPNKPINDTLFAFLEADLRDRSPKERYFLDNGHGRPWSTDSTGLSKNMRTEMEKLGFPKGIKPFHHGIRASGITLLLNNGVSPQIVQQLADHSNLATTMSYYNTRSSSQQQAVDLLSDAFKPSLQKK